MSIKRSGSEHRSTELTTLRASERKFRQLLENSLTNITIINREGVYLLMNSRAAASFGLTPSEAEGKYISDLLPPSTARKYLEWNADFIDNGTVREYEDTFLIGSEYRTFLILDQVLTDDSGHRYALQSNAMDITERKRNESELVRMREQYRELSRHFLIVRESERARIAREIHDELGQSLSALKIDLDRLLNNLGPESPLRSNVEKMIGLTGQSITEVQRIAYDLKPAILDDLGLIASIRWYCGEFENRNGISCRTNISDQIATDPEVSLLFFRILQESLTNISRHAAASGVVVRLFLRGDRLILTVQDNGIGISPEAIRSEHSFGLMGMRERARMHGGRLEIGKAKQGGTKVMLDIPLPGSKS